MHVFLLYFLVSIPTAIAGAAHGRRSLHQPFFPRDFPTTPPSQPPSPSPSSLPFLPTPTTTTPPDDKPFFPDFPSPLPPPRPPSTASFPANISSLNLPISPEPKPTSHKLIIAAAALAAAAAIVISVLIVLKIQKRRMFHGNDESLGQEKTYRSSSRNSNRAGFSDTENNGGSGGANSYNRIPKLTRPSQTSAEFLYLGTLVNSHGGIGATGSSNAEDSTLRKMDSPELRPLPPLSGGGGAGERDQNVLRHNGYENAEVEDEFYSPRESVGTGSGSRNFSFTTAAATGSYEQRRATGSGSSSSYSSSSSGSPARSFSLSISPPVSLSPISSRPKSPELVEIQTAPPPSRPPPPPPPPPQPHPLFIPSPVVGLSKDSVESSPRLSNSSSDENSPSPARVPPPPPPPEHLESQNQTTPTPAARPPLKPPVLTRPTNVNRDPPLISPMEPLPENQENLETFKPKLKPLHWDKVRASSDRETVWDHFKSGSFKLNEEMIETLFVVKPPNSSNPNDPTTKHPFFPSPIGLENRVLDPKKSQNIAISLRALNVTADEVCDALLEGNGDTLGTELLETLLKMAPTKEEERKLKEYNEDSSSKLGPAEKFLKAVLDIPFAFKRIDAMLYVSNFDSDLEYLKRTFITLEAACGELRNSRMFLKLLEAVLKTGNRMNVGTNRGDAQAFKLDTLLKLVDVKGTDGKTTLLHFVVQEIIRTEGARLCNNDVHDDAKCRKLGLPIVSSLTAGLSNVKKAAAMDSDVLNGYVTRLSNGVSDVLDVVRLNDGTRFSESMNEFTKTAEEEIVKIQAQEIVAFSLVKEATEYFHGNSAKEEAHPFRIFTVVRDFLMVLDRVCKEIGAMNERIVAARKFPIPVNPMLPPVFTGFPDRQKYSSSDEEEERSSSM